MKVLEFTRKLSQKIQATVSPQAILTRDVLEDLGQTVVDDMKYLIAKGESPIEGRGVFPAYKNPEKYPGKRKPHVPVNLELTGDMLGDLRFRINQAKIAVTIYYATKKSQLKELGHRQGKNGQPRRPSLPSEREGFVKGTVAKLDRIVTAATKKAVRSLKI